MLCFFVTVVEIIAIKIRENYKIQGIKIVNVVKKLDQNADDMWNTAIYYQITYQEIRKEYMQFQAFTGLMINFNKTACLGALSVYK